MNCTIFFKDPCHLFTDEECSSVESTCIISAFKLNNMILPWDVELTGAQDSPFWGGKWYCVIQSQSSAEYLHSFGCNRDQASQKDAYSFSVSSWIKNPLGELKALLKFCLISKFLSVCNTFLSLNNILTTLRIYLMCFTFLILLILSPFPFFSDMFSLKLFIFH